MLAELLAWLPLIVVVGLFLWLGMRQMRDYRRHVEEVKGINDELVQISRETIAELREIKEILKDRKH